MGQGKREASQVSKSHLPLLYFPRPTLVQFLVILCFQLQTEPILKLVLPILNLCI